MHAAVYTDGWPAQPQAKEEKKEEGKTEERPELAVPAQCDPGPRGLGKHL